MIEYVVRIDDPRLHTVRIEARIPTGGAPQVEFAIPAWTPGSYLLREFARYLSEPTAAVGGEERAAKKVAKGTWRVEASGAEYIEVCYEIYGHELTVRTPHVDGSHAYFLGSNAFVYRVGDLGLPSSVRVHAPDGWETFCPLATDDAGRFVAPDFDVLADAPFEIGPHRSHAFDAAGVPHRFVFWGDDAVTIDMARLERDVRALVEHNAAHFGGELPYENYDFVFHITANARGGLEHLNSTVLATPWRYFDSDEGYAEMLGLISHEHFHTWNVKRIRPRALGPFDYQNENHTTALWVVEGFTSYFDSLGCLRSGVVEPSTWLTWLAKDLRRLFSTPGRKNQSLAQSSWDAWIRLYRPDDNTPNRTVSYYLKGALVSLGLDLTIRERTSGKRSLDDVMRTLWADFLETGEGYDDDGMAEVIRRATGVDVRAELDAWVFSTDEPDFGALLEAHGLDIEREGPDEPWLGVDTEEVAGGLAIKHVRADGPAHGSELAPGDILIAVDGRRLSGGALPAIVRRLKAGEPATIHAFRRDRLFETQVTPAPAPRNEVKLTPVANPSKAQRALFQAWTGQALPSPETLGKTGSES